MAVGKVNSGSWYLKVDCDPRSGLRVLTNLEASGQGRAT
jgi:hypothetical protein